jgi:predicted aminopeptidase
VAFSTLGWFADPLLSNLLRYDRATLADVIIHELLHNTSYLAGRADFDESFANFVGLRGAIAFFAAHGDEADHAKAKAAWDDAARFSDFIGRFSTRLRNAYAAGVTLSDRQRLFAEAQEEFNQWPQRPESYREFGTERLNNAVILQYLMYADRLQLFETLFEQQHGDLRQTIQVVIDAVRSNGKDPFAAIQDLQKPAGSGEQVVRAAVTARLLPGVVPRNARNTRRPPASA